MKKIKYPTVFFTRHMLLSFKKILNYWECILGVVPCLLNLDIFV